MVDFITDGFEVESSACWYPTENYTPTKAGFCFLVSERQTVSRITFTHGTDLLG